LTWKEKKRKGEQTAEVEEKITEGRRLFAQIGTMGAASVATGKGKYLARKKASLSRGVFDSM
jgi:hypothetical protein